MTDVLIVSEIVSKWVGIIHFYESVQTSNCFLNCILKYQYIILCNNDNNNNTILVKYKIVI